MARCIMVQGTMSGAGKSLLATALCRIFRQDGLRVAPFKSQNMALNSYITRDGLEMGRAQVAQAEAAGREPDVRMNPVLLKPSSDTGSQLIVNGEVRGQYRAAEYFKMKKSLVPEILHAYESLAAENDVIVIEGAGSPAEINLRDGDIVNMGLAELVNAPVLLVGDIDRGGVFAQLYGTVALLQPEERARVVGTVINKFRGDVELLRPGLAMLEEKTGVPVLGVVPYTRADIDDEDSLAPCLAQTQQRRPLDIAVVRLPRISNFTDFSPLESHPALGVRYVERAGPGGAAGHKKHDGRPCLDAPERTGGRGKEAGGRGHARAGRVRRLPDAGNGAGRPGRRGAGRPHGRHGPFALRDALYRAEGAHPCAGVCRRRPVCGRAAGRLRDPYGPHRTRRHAAVLPACGRHARGRGGRQCVRHLSARPV